MQSKVPVMVLQDQQVVHGVVAGKACDRRAKYLFAHVTGAPCLKAHHLDRWAPHHFKHTSLFSQLKSVGPMIRVQAVMDVVAYSGVSGPVSGFPCEPRMHGCQPGSLAWCSTDTACTCTAKETSCSSLVPSSGMLVRLFASARDTARHITIHVP